MAEQLGVGQEGISRLEKGGDLLISTLRNYVCRISGRLDLVARFSDRQDVLLQDLAGSGADAPRSSPAKNKRPRSQQRHA